MLMRLHWAAKVAYEANAAAHFASAAHAAQ